MRPVARRRSMRRSQQLWAIHEDEGDDHGCEADQGYRVARSDEQTAPMIPPIAPTIIIGSIVPSTHRRKVRDQKVANTIPGGV